MLSHNEHHTVDSIVQLTPVSSGFQIGASCWNLEVGHLKLAIVTNASIGLDYRHPKPIQTTLLKNCDVLLLSGIAAKTDVAPFDQQITHFLNTLTNCLHSHLNSKVLLPVQPTFILEVIDLLLHKVDDHVQIVFMSESALSLIEYANINLEYLNPMLQNKIYVTENPLSF